jgi:hypothetical protein
MVSHSLEEAGIQIIGIVRNVGKKPMQVGSGTLFPKGVLRL